MTSDGGRPVPRRPVHFGPDDLEAHGGTLPGPAETTEMAHQTAAILVGAGRAAHDPEVRITSYNVCYTKLLRAVGAGGV